MSVESLKHELLTSKTIDPVGTVEKIEQEFDVAQTSDQRGTVLALFRAVNDLIERQLISQGDAQATLLADFRKARFQRYKILIAKECLVGENINAKIMAAVLRREVEAGRMAPDGTMEGQRSEPIPLESNRGKILNDDVDRARMDAINGVVSPPRTVLLYRLDSHPAQMGVSKIDPPLEAGAFFLDFTRPLQLMRHFLGISNTRIGRPVWLRAPIVHEGEEKGGYTITVDRVDPVFSQVRALWKERYPSKPVVPHSIVGGFKLIGDFATQFPDDS